MRKAALPLLYAHAHNALLAYLKQSKIREKLPSQAELARVCKVSVTTIHRILRTLRQGDLLKAVPEGLILRRHPRKKDFLPEPPALSRRDEVEQTLIEQLVSGKFKAGESFSELSLAREHGVTTGTIREVLLSLTRLGIFTKQARKQWRMIEVDEKIVNELMNLRILMETFGLRCYFSGPPDSELADEFRRIYAEMLVASRRARPAVQEFVRLDRELHQTILLAARNRFLMDYSRYISFPIQFQFLRRAFDAELMGQGAEEHLRLLKAINARDEDKALRYLVDHLEHSRATLLGLAGRLSLAGNGDVPRRYLRAQAQSLRVF